MTGTPAFHPFYGDDGKQIGWQSEDLATVVAMDQLPQRAAASPSLSAPAGILDFLGGSQASAAALPPGFDTPVPYETKGDQSSRSSALPPGFDTPVPYAEHPEKQKPDANEPDRGWLGSINNVVGGFADAAASAIPFSDAMGAGVRAGARGITNLIQGKDADLGGTYDRALTDIRGRDKQFAQEHPYLA